MYSWHSKKGKGGREAGGSNGVSPSQTNSKKEITILEPQVPDDVLSSPGHHMLRTGTAFIDYVAESPVAHSSIWRHGDHKNDTTIFWWRSATTKIGHNIFDQVIQIKPKKWGLKTFFFLIKTFTEKFTGIFAFLPYPKRCF